jgi:uncharacterized protein (DUF2225 family)
MIATRHVRKTHTCPACGEKFERDELITEVIAYGVEYMRDFNEITGSVSEEKAKRKDAALQDAMAKLGYGSFDTGSESLDETSDVD